MSRSNSSHISRINVNTKLHLKGNKGRSIQDIKNLFDTKSMKKYSEQLRKNRFSKNKVRLSQINLDLKQNESQMFFTKRCNSSFKLRLPNRELKRSKRFSSRGSLQSLNKEVLVSKASGRSVSQPRPLLCKRDSKIVNPKTQRSSPKRIGIMEYETQFFRTNLNMGVLNNKEYLTRCKKIDPKMGSNKVFGIIYCSLQDIWKDKKEYCNQLRNMRKHEVLKAARKNSE
ncbi:unnamed protein product [Moneuplotes crassus]|uniref:Uncharacterized protein n=2 Tax=Euplotes crassus TaxID=5936 RepID=A0AAD1UIQ1_EUPCR|nr:unnamed protein product [Moneuplotes crassus]